MCSGCVIEPLIAPETIDKVETIHKGTFPGPTRHRVYALLGEQQRLKLNGVPLAL